MLPRWTLYGSVIAFLVQAPISFLYKVFWVHDYHLQGALDFMNATTFIFECFSIVLIVLASLIVVYRRALQYMKNKSN